MANKLWEKNVQVNAEIDRFTVGRDRELDLYLAPYDVLGSMAHITMLESIGLLTKEELDALLAELRDIYTLCQRGEFVIEDDIEDVHSQVELLLTRRLGDMGKKIHSGRSRNDQVLVDLKLFTRDRLQRVVEKVKNLFDALQRQSERYKEVLMPGYTHLQVAMPSSFGLWFGAYADRGKTERNVASALASVAGTVAKMAFDACLYNSQNFGFVRLPAECTTGSSIMPHKKNPDVFELIRAKCNKLQGLPTQVLLIMNNLPSGYFRDLQIIKEVFVPAFDELDDCLDMATYIVERMEVNEHILNDARYDAMFSVEEVNRRVYQGTPFRDAYRQVGLEIEAGQFTPDKAISHTHEGSIGNLCNDQIRQHMAHLLDEFHFERAQAATDKLLGK